MKVLQVINNLDSGGAEKLLINTIPRYLKMGVDLELLLIDGRDYPFLNSFKQERMVKIHKLTTQRSVYNPIHIFKMIRFFRRYDLIHVHLFPAFYFTAITKALTKSSSKLIYTEHNYLNNRRSIFLFRMLDRLMYDCYDKIIAVSEIVELELRKHVKSKTWSKIVCIENGIDLDEIQNATPANTSNLDFETCDKLILQVSSFTPQKNQETLIRSLRLLPKNYKLILIGDGPLLVGCKALVNKLKLGKRVYFLGRRNDVFNWLKRVDFVVLSSHYEGLSLSCLEGMASGRPFLASDAPGLTSIVKGYGILFKIGDFNELAFELKKLGSDDEYYDKVVENCLSRVKDYDIKKMIESHMTLYKSILSFEK